MEITSKKIGLKTTKKAYETDSSSKSSLERSQGSLDFNLIAMAKNLKENGSDGLFTDQMKLSYEKIALDVRLCRHLLSLRDANGLDNVAQQMTQNALIIGAQRILTTAVDLQGLARMEDYPEIEKRVSEMEHELLLVKEEIQRCS